MIGQLAALQLLDHLRQRPVGDEAQVERARHRQMGLGLELVTAAMDVDLLVAEAQRVPAARERFQAHAEHARVEVDAGRCIDGGEHQVVEVVDQDGGACAAPAAAASSRIALRAQQHRHVDHRAIDGDVPRLRPNPQPTRRGAPTRTRPRSAPAPGAPSATGAGGCTVWRRSPGAARAAASLRRRASSSIAGVTPSIGGGRPASRERQHHLGAVRRQVVFVVPAQAEVELRGRDCRTPAARTPGAAASSRACAMPRADSISAITRRSPRTRATACIASARSALGHITAGTPGCAHDARSSSMPRCAGRVDAHDDTRRIGRTPPEPLQQATHAPMACRPRRPRLRDRRSPHRRRSRARARSGRAGWPARTGSCAAASGNDQPSSRVSVGASAMRHTRCASARISPALAPPLIAPRGESPCLRARRG